MADPQPGRHVMLPDWEPQERFWLAWPPAGGIEATGGDEDAVRDVIADIAHTLAEMGQVTVLTNPAELAEVSIALGGGIGAIVASHRHAGMREIGPAFLVSPEGGRAILRCQGDPASDAVIEQAGMPVVEVGLRLCPGMVDVDGTGLCLASTALLTHGAGQREEVERHLRGLIGVERFIWLDGAVEGDNSGTLLNVARFVAPGIVLLAGTASDEDPNRLVFETNRQRLEQARDVQGLPLTIVELQTPKPRRHKDGRRVPMSYTNCLMAGSLILLPAFESSWDQGAYDAVIMAVPDRKIALIDALDLARAGLGLGSLMLPQPKLPMPTVAETDASLT